MHYVPTGPLSAFDCFEGETIVFDDIRNQIVLNRDNVTKKLYIKERYYSESYYWTRIFFISRDTILCLLKSHANRVFYLVSFRLDREEQKCIDLEHVKTGVYSKGYHIGSHRAGSQIVISISNLKNINEENEKSALSSENKCSSSAIARSRSDSDIELALYSEKKGLCEGVILVVQCIPTGNISGTVVTLGKERLGFKLRRMRSIRQFKDILGTKFMTRWTSSTDDILCEPILCGDVALLLSRSDPSSCYVMKTVLGPSHSIGTSLVNAFTNRLRTSTSEIDPTLVDITGVPPDTQHIWSNVDVVNGFPVVLTIAPDTGYSQIFVLKQQGAVIKHYHWSKYDVELKMVSTSRISHIFIRTIMIDYICHLTVRAYKLENESTKSIIEHLTINI